MSEPRYPEVKVKLIGQDGNSFAILGRVRQALKRADVPQKDINEYFNEAMSGDYDHLLRTTMEWVTVS